MSGLLGGLTSLGEGAVRVAARQVRIISLALWSVFGMCIIVGASIAYQFSSGQSSLVSSLLGSLAALDEGAIGVTTGRVRFLLHALAAVRGTSEVEACLPSDHHGWHGRPWLRSRGPGEVSKTE